MSSSRPGDAPSTTVVVSPVQDRAVRVELTGVVDIGAATVVRSGIIDTVHDLEVDSVLVDLSGVPTVDSSGIGAFVGAWKYARAHQVDLRVVNPSVEVSRVLRSLGLAGVLGLDAED
jgi:anti-anti-sigma factor